MPVQERSEAHMSVPELVQALRRIRTMDELRCFGCGHEHNCSIHGCTIIRQAVDVIDPENPSSDNLADIQFKYSFAALDFLGRFETVDNTKNILTVWATLDNGEERVRSIDITPYLKEFDQLCMVARIDVDVSSDNLKLGVVFAEFEEGLWEYYNIGKK